MPKLRGRRFDPMDCRGKPGNDTNRVLDQQSRSSAY